MVQAYLRIKHCPREIRPSSVCREVASTFPVNRAGIQHAEIVQPSVPPSLHFLPSFVVLVEPCRIPHPLPIARLKMFRQIPWSQETAPCPVGGCPASLGLSKSIPTLLATLFLSWRDLPASQRQLFCVTNAEDQSASTQQSRCLS